MRRPPVFALGLLTVLPLAACTRTTTDEAVIPDTTVGAATPYPDGGGPAVTPIPVDASVVAETGFGPVRVGMGDEPAREAMGTDARLGTASEGSTCRSLDWTTTHPGVSFMSVDGRIVRVDVSRLDGPDEIAPADLPRTAAGPGIGSTEADVRAAYAGHLRDEPHHYVEGGRYLIATPADTSSAIVFETDGRVVTEMRAGLRPYVEWVEGCS